MSTREDILRALSEPNAPVGALCDRDALAAHLADRLAEEGGPREWATRVTSTVDDRPPLILPAPSKDPAQAHAAAQAQARTINADDGAASAEVVWRPAGGWRASDDPWPGGN